MYTISCRNGKCTPTINEKGLNEEGRRVAKERAEEQLGLLRDVQADLEEVDAVFYSHDVPWQFVGHEYVGWCWVLADRIEECIRGRSECRRM